MAFDIAIPTPLLKAILNHSFVALYYIMATWVSGCGSLQRRWLA